MVLALVATHPARAEAGGAKEIPGQAPSEHFGGFRQQVQRGGRLSPIPAGLTENQGQPAVVARSNPALAELWIEGCG